jgi:hypothetical protein
MLRRAALHKEQLTSTATEFRSCLPAHPFKWQHFSCASLKSTNRPYSGSDHQCGSSASQVSSVCMLTHTVTLVPAVSAARSVPRRRPTAGPPAQGASDRPQGAKAGGTLASHAADLGALVRSLPRPPVLAGHSFGGLVVQRCGRACAPRRLTCYAARAFAVWCYRYASARCSGDQKLWQPSQPEEHHCPSVASRKSRDNNSQ